MPERLWSLEDGNLAGASRDDFVWRFSVEENGATRMVDVVNPRTEWDGDDGGTWLVGDFDSFTIDGREPTDEEADDYSDELRREIRREYSVT